MVYGEYIQSPQVEFAKKISKILPGDLNSTYFVNSGSEAIEGALSVMGNEEFKNSFRPLLPDVKFLTFNLEEDLEKISNKTACVLIEPVQGEAGIRIPENDFLKKLRKRCDETGTLLIFDEIQTGFGRIGSFFASIEFDVVPDIMTIAKGMGGGMPIGAFISTNEIMSCLKTNPILGHITTFGGHPVSCAAASATLDVLTKENIIGDVKRKGELFRKYLTHPQIREIRGMGLFMAVELKDFTQVKKVLDIFAENGLISDWFLFHDSAFRIAPPLIITDEEIVKACNIINESIESSI